MQNLWREIPILEELTDIIKMLSIHNLFRRKFAAICRKMAFCALLFLTHNAADGSYRVTTKPPQETPRVFETLTLFTSMFI